MHVMLTVNASWNALNFRRPIIQYLVGSGHQVTLLAPIDSSVAEIEELGCRVIPLQMNVKGINPFDDLRLIMDYVKVFRIEKPDLVLSFTIKNNIFGALAARFCGTPFVPNVTGLGTAFLSSGVMRSIAKLLYRTAFSKLELIFFQNEDDRSLFVEERLVVPGQTRVLPGSGIDLKKYSLAEYCPDQHPATFLMISRLLRDKGVVEFVDAARLVLAEFPNARFQLLGALGSENRTAVDNETLQAWVDEGAVEYLGTTSDVRPYIAASTCVVLPSYREGAPRTLIEAAAMGRPLIATDVPGCRAVVDDGETGLLCRVKSAESLASVLIRFQHLSEEKKKAMGLAGRQKMLREFDQKIVVDAYKEALSLVSAED